MTITELAEICGVSIKTVSRVINDEPNVRAETRDLVRTTMRKHKYRPSVFARNLGRKTVTTLLISIRRTRSFANTIWLERLLKEVIDAAQEVGFRVLVETYFDEFDEKKSAMIEGSLVDAVIVFYERHNDARIELAKEFGIPVVVFGHSAGDVPYVSNKNEEAMTNAYAYLFSRGLRRSRLILGDKFGTNLDRYEGARRAHQEKGIDTALLEVDWGVNSPETVKNIVSAAIQSGDLPDVFFISGDEKALGAYNAIHECGLRIPDDISVVGFDDIPVSRYLTPPLTTIRQDFRGLAYALVDCASRLIEGEQGGRGVEVPTELIIRGSTR